MTEGIRRTLVRNLVVLGRALRASGIAVSPGQIADFQVALGLIDGHDRGQLYSAARATFVRRAEDIASFDRAFWAFWRAVSRGGAEAGPPTFDATESLGGVPEEGSPVDSTAREGSLPDASPTLEGSLVEDRARTDDLVDPSPETPVLVRTYSALEMLRDKDFGTLTLGELDAARDLVRRVRWQTGSRRSRRMRAAHRGEIPDLRATLRKSVGASEDLVSLVWRQPKTRPHPIVVLGDVSGSMDRYTRLLIQFFYALKRGRRDVEVFAFGTRLTRITHELDHHRVDEAMRQVAMRVRDWSGGTRIGAAFGAFNRHWARQMLGRSAITVIVSDGWDRGDPEELAREIGRLQRRSYRLVWLNPLLGSADYEPLTVGMKAALPYVDDFLPAHNLSSLASLADRLAELESSRPIRRQRGAPTTSVT